MASEDQTTTKPLLSNKFYDVLKLFALIINPAIGTLYFTLAQIWGWSGAEAVVSTVVAIDVFLGVVIKLGDVTYNASDARFDGAMIIEQKPGSRKTFSLNLHDEPENLADKKEIIFKVKPEERDSTQPPMFSEPH